MNKNDPIITITSFCGLIFMYLTLIAPVPAEGLARLLAHITFVIAAVTCIYILAKCRKIDIDIKAWCKKRQRESSHALSEKYNKMSVGFPNIVKHMKYILPITILIILAVITIFLFSRRSTPVHPTQWTIHFNGNNNTGGNPPEQIQTYINETLPEITISQHFVRAGYTLMGFYTHQNWEEGSRVWNDDGTVVPVSHTLEAYPAVGVNHIQVWARWSRTQWTLYFQGNGNTSGFAPTSIVVQLNHALPPIIIADNFLRTGFKLDGFYSHEIGGHRIWNANGTVVPSSHQLDEISGQLSVVHVYARWIEL